jgi:hypothetical protein
MPAGRSHRRRPLGPGPSSRSRNPCNKSLKFANNWLFCALLAARIRITEGRELYDVRAKLERYPQVVAAILQMASNLHRPVDTLSAAVPRNLSQRPGLPYPSKC